MVKSAKNVLLTTQVNSKVFMVIKIEIVEVKGTVPKGFLTELIEGYRFSLKFDENAKEKHKLLDQVNIFEAD